MLPIEKIFNEIKLLLGTEDVTLPAMEEIPTFQRSQALLQASSDYDNFNHRLNSAVEDSWETFQALLARNSVATVGEEVLTKATKKWQHSTNNLKALLKLPNTLVISEAVVQIIVREARPEVVELLLQRREPVPLTQNVLVAASRSFIFGDGVVQLLLPRYVNIHVSEDVLIAAASNEGKGKQIMTSLLLHDPTIRLTPKTLETALNNVACGSEIAELLREHLIEVDITKDMMKSAARWHSEGLFEVLLLQGGESLLDEEVVEEATRNYWHGAKIMRLLIHQIAIGSSGKKLATYVVAAADEETVQLLLEQKASSRLLVAMIKGAVRNYQHGEKLLQLLAPKLDEESITEEVATGISSRANKETVQRLLAKTRSPHLIHAIILGARGNFKHGEIIRQSLVIQLGAEKITEKVATDIASIAHVETVKLLLDRKRSFYLINAAIKGAAQNHQHGEKILQWLLPQLDKENITEEIATEVASSANKEMVQLFLAEKQSARLINAMIKGVAQNYQHGEKVLQSLLPQLDKESITEEAVTKFASKADEETVQHLLNRIGSFRLFNAVIKGAAQNYQHGEKILQSLLPQLDEKSITEEVATEISSIANEETVQLLLAKKGSSRLISAMIKGAARNYQHGEKILQLLRSGRMTAIPENPFQLSTKRTS